MWPAPAARTDLKDRRAELGPTASPDPWDMPEKRANWACRDCQDIPGDRVPRAQVASLGSLEPMGRKEAEVSLVSQALEDREALRVHVEVEAPGVLQASQGQRVLLAMMDPPDLLVNGDLKDHRVQLASLDPKDPLALQGKMVCPDILDSGGRLASRERQVPQDLEVSSVPRDPPERRVRSASEVTQDLRAHLESKVYQALLAKRGQRATQDPRGAPVKTVLPVCVDSPGSEDCLVPQALLV